MLPDPLNHLRSQYDQIVSDYEDGSISFEQAQQALDNLVTIDGAGQHWSIDVNGDFTCAGAPGMPPERTEPNRFVHAQLPARGPAAPPWAQQLGPGGPGAPGGGPAPMPGGFPGGGQPGGPTVPVGVPTGQIDPTTGTYQPPADPIVPTSRSLNEPDDADSLKAKLAANPVAGKLGAVISNNKRLLIILALVVGLLAGLTVYQRIVSDPLADTGNAIPGSDQPAAPDTDGLPAPPPPPGEDGGDTDNGGQAAGELPSVERVQQVISAVTSGDRNLAASVIADPGSATSIALNTAIYAGWDDARVALLPEALVDEDGAVLQTWVLQDADSGTQYATTPVTWVRTDDGWKLASWPRTN